MRIAQAQILFLFCVTATVGCNESSIGDMTDAELITTVTVTFTAEDGGDPVVAQFDDPDGTGGLPATLDEIRLTAGMTYTMTVRFHEKLAVPPRETTEEVRAEGTEYQLFFTGNGVNGPAADSEGAPLIQQYADVDTEGLPIGLSNTVIASVPSTGAMMIRLQYLPSLPERPLKVANLAEFVRDNGLQNAPGAAVASIPFAVTVH